MGRERDGAGKHWASFSDTPKDAGCLTEAQHCLDRGTARRYTSVTAEITRPRRVGVPNGADHLIAVPAQCDDRTLASCP